MNQVITKCMWDNCETVHIDACTVRKLVIDYAKQQLTPKQVNELVPATIKICSGGVCEDLLSSTYKVFFCEQEFVKEVKKK